MAAAGPRGRDGPSPREFTAVRHFMMADLGLSGLPLLVYARIFGFCDAGCGYCARGCRPERWQPLTIRQGSRRERVTKCQGSQPEPLTK